MGKDDFAPDEFVRYYDANIDLADELMRKWASKAKKAGYIRDGLRAARPYWVGVAGEWEMDPLKTELASSGEDFVGTQSAELHRLLEAEPETETVLDAAVSTLTVFVRNASTASHVIPVADVPPLEHIPDPSTVQSEVDSYATRMGKLDSALESTYRGIWDALYGTEGDPERAALLLMRQSFDHLFDKLAPDEEVRKSRFWKEKLGDRPDQVYRQEKMEYAAHTHVSDSLRADSLRATSRSTLAVYQALQRAHERGELDREKALDSLFTVKALLETWVDEIDL